MKHIYVNLKRFDVPISYGGVNSLAPVENWAHTIVAGTSEGLKAQADHNVHFTMFFPEAHLLPAAAYARQAGSPVEVGCQGVYREDVSAGGNFGAFTTNLPAAAAKALGCGAALIGHCEERRDLAGVLAEAGCTDAAAVNRTLNKEVLCATEQGLNVLYCIGETADEQDEWQDVLAKQLAIGLAGADKSHVTIAYEPVWAIGPGKTPPNAGYIQKIARFVKAETGDLPVVYGGGLKADNAAMLAGIPEIDGGLIALTHFSGDIGFYPNEFLEIVRLYLEVK